MQKNCKLFEGISQEEYTTMMNCFEAKERTYSLGETILDYSKESKKVGIIKEGGADVIRIDMDGNKYILESLEVNSIFGEVIAFSGGGRDSIYIECTSPCRVLFLEYDHITKRCENACKHHTILVQNLFRIISDKLIAMSSRVEVLSNKTIRQKLMCYFNICVVSSSKGSTFELPFSISHLADYIAADRSAVTRELKNMKDEGLIQMNKRTISLL